MESLSVMGLATMHANDGGGGGSGGARDEVEGGVTMSYAPPAPSADAVAPSGGSTTMLQQPQPQQPQLYEQQQMTGQRPTASVPLALQGTLFAERSVAQSDHQHQHSASRSQRSRTRHAQQPLNPPAQPYAHRGSPRYVGTAGSEASAPRAAFAPATMQGQSAGPRTAAHLVGPNTSSAPSTRASNGDGALPAPAASNAQYNALPYADHHSHAGAAASTGTSSGGAGAAAARDEMERQFMAVKAEIDATRIRTEKLAHLLEQMQQNPNCFDEEDVLMVGTALDEMQRALMRMEDEFQRRMGIYDTVVVRLRQNINARQKMLEALDRDMRVLEENPALKAFFVRKQVELRRSYNEMCSELAGRGAAPNG